MKGAFQTLSADPPPSRGSAGLQRLAFAAFLLQVFVSDRFVVQFATGGTGLLRVPDIVFPVVLLGAVLLARDYRALSFLRAESFWLLWAPFMVLGVVLPTIGVALNGYPFRTLISVLRQGVLPICAMLLGAWLSEADIGTKKRMKLWLRWVILGEIVYAVLVMFARLGFLGSVGFLSALAKWDTQIERLYSSSYIIFGRAVGTFINPNVLGMWSVIFVWYVWLMESGVWKVTLSSGLIMVLLLSQSRGAFVALIISACAYVALQRIPQLVRSGELSGRSALTTLLAVFLVLGVVFLVLQAVGSSVVVSRASSLWSALTSGAAGVPALEARIQTWGRAADFFEKHPLGTLGSPELRFGGAVDNEYVRVLLQGGLVYMIAYVGMLADGLRLWWSQQRQVRLLGALTAVVSIEALTALPLSYAPIGLFWLYAGMALHLKVRRRIEIYEAQ